MEASPASLGVVGVDTGGTFTDIYASSGRVLKVPSTPWAPVEAILSGLDGVGVGPGDAVAHGTTVATNTVLERKGARTALLTTAGFEDVLAIRRQTRPSLYDLTARWPDPLVPRELRFGVVERLDFQGNVLQALDLAAVRSLIDDLRAAGVESLAVCLLFAYANPQHERALAEAVAQKLGDSFPLSLSHQVAPQYGEYERTSTTVVNAYVMPVMRRYLQALASEMQQMGISRLHVMHSNGGLVSARSVAERPVGTILSGPAAGVVGARTLTSAAGHDQIITFDMGGTSTDVAVVPGDVLERGDGEIGSFPLLIPMLTIETVGAGGGSIARVDIGGGLHVGPESAGADPGPASYGRGSQPTVTDANLLLGRLSPRGLLGGEMPLDLERARQAVGEIARSLGLGLEQAAWAIVRLANSNMERAVRAVTLQRGYDPRRFTLFAFGGAGPLHAAELAEGLGIARVLVPPHPGVMAALGLTVPDLQRDFYRTVLLRLEPDLKDRLQRAFAELEAQARAELAGEDLEDFGEPTVQPAVDARFLGQSFDLRIPYVPSVARLRDAFLQAHQERYGYAAPDEVVEIVNVRLRVRLPRLTRPCLVPGWPEASHSDGGGSSRPVEMRPVWFGAGAIGRVGVADLRQLETATLWRPSLSVGTAIVGPAVIEQYDSVTVIPPGWQARVDGSFNLVLTGGTV